MTVDCTVSADADASAENGGQDKQPHPVHPDRWADGTMRPGNQAARKHGAYSVAVQRGQVPDDLRVDVDVMQEQIVADLGGVENLSAIQVGYVRKLRDVEVVERMLISHIATNGLFTPRGRVRAVYTRWLEAVGTWDRLAQRIGMDRRARLVDPFEAVKAAVQEANQP